MAGIPRALVSVVVVAAVALTACGGGSSDADSAARVRLLSSSAAKTAEATSARMSMTMSFEGGDADAAGTIRIDGAVDMRSGDASMKMSGAGLDAMGIGAARGPDAVEVRIVDQVMYLGGEGLSEADPSLKGKDWVKFDFQALADRFGGDAGAGSPAPLAQSDLSGTLEMLRGVSGAVEEVGREDVRGVATTHYRAEIDPKRALDEVPAARREKAAKALEKLGDAKFPADVWIDDQDRVRKLTLTVDAGKLDVPGAAQAGKATITYELYDFGVDVAVTAPPPDEVIDLGELFAAFGQAFEDLGEGLGSLGEEATPPGS